MDQYGYIRTAYRVYQKSIKQICRETGHSRETVRKVLRSEPFGYAPRVEQPYPVMGLYLQVIDQWLAEDKDRPKKQRHTAKRIYDRLVRELGFKGSDSTVRHYVRKAKMRLGVQVTPTFIPLEPECGQEAEIDWGAATAIIAGEKVPVKYFCMRSKYSGKHFVRCYPCERQQAFLDGHIQAFAFFGGIFRILIYDNLTAAVQKVLRGKGRVEQEEFIKFHAYYSFTPRFCNPASAHEKGGVEGLVGYVRRNYLVPIPVAESFEDLNDKLLSECLAYGDHRIKGREGTVNELFAGEQSHLLSLPEMPCTVIQATTAKVDAYATVIVDKNRYSVPTLYTGLKVKVHLAVACLEIFSNGKKVATHPRLFGNNKWQLNPDHYLELIQQRPGAFHSARPLRRWRETWPASLEKLLARFQQSQGETVGIKDFISVLMLYREYAGQEIEAAVELALTHHLSSSQGVKHLLQTKSEPGHAPLQQWPATLIPDVSVYGQLGGVS